VPAAIRFDEKQYRSKQLGEHGGNGADRADRGDVVRLMQRGERHACDDLVVN
jgi:hypothetical protein